METEFWNRVKECLKAKGLTQKDIAIGCGVPFNTVAGWIAKGRFPDIDKAIVISDILEESLEYLVTGKLSQINSEDNEVLDYYHRISDDVKPIIKSMLKGFSDIQEKP